MSAIERVIGIVNGKSRRAPSGFGSMAESTIGRYAQCGVIRIKALVEIRYVAGLAFR